MTVEDFYSDIAVKLKAGDSEADVVQWAAEKTIMDFDDTLPSIAEIVRYVRD